MIAVAAGAGGHAGTISPFPLIQEIREWFDGPLALSGAIATGRAVLAAQAAGADFAYIGSAFIATQEARAEEEYKEMITESASSDIIYSICSPVFTATIFGPRQYVPASIRTTFLKAILPRWTSVNRPGSRHGNIYGEASRASGRSSRCSLLPILYSSWFWNTGRRWPNCKESSRPILRAHCSARTDDETRERWRQRWRMGNCAVIWNEEGSRRVRAFKRF